jgi:uncharacterized membrane protein
MKLSNPLEMNDWRISSFMLFSFSALALLWITFILNSNGFQIPLFQQVAGCICLLFIPGIAVLRTLRLHKLGSIETPLYAIGISISVVIFAGLLLNTVAPLAGINNPLSPFHLILVFSGIIVALCIASYRRDKDFAAPTQLPTDKLSPRLLSLLLLPFLSIFGAYLVNYYEINWLILFMLIGVGIVVLAISLRSEAGGSTYALAIFVISLSLLFSNALISRYLWGWDVYVEAYVANQVINSAVWNPATIASGSGFSGGGAQYNSVLSTALFAPIVSQIGNINITSMFKIVYPVLYALVPVALYQLFRKQTSDIVAFLSSFFFVSILEFSTEMLSLPRQELAELFLVLVLLLIFNKTFRTSTRAILLVLFSGSVVVSHYGVAYLFMIQLIAVFILLFIADNGFLNGIRRKLVRNNPASESTTAGSATSRLRKKSAITAVFVLMFVTMTFMWYIYTAGGLVFGTFLNTVVNTITADFFSSASAQLAAKVHAPQAARAAAKLQTGEALLILITDRLNTFTTLLVLLGVAVAFVQRKRLRFEREYLAFALTSCGLVILTFTMPTFFLAFNGSRLQHFSLIVLAPFCIVSIVTLCRVPRLIMRTGDASFEPGRKSYIVASVFLVILLLFNVGFVSAVTSQPMNYPVPALFHEQFSLLFLNSQDLAGAKWLGSAYAEDAVYGNYSSVMALLAYGNVPPAKTLLLSPGGPQKSTLSYPGGPQINMTYAIYVRSSDIAYMEKSGESSQQLAADGLPSTQFTATLNKVYDSGCAIYVT